MSLPNSSEKFRNTPQLTELDKAVLNERIPDRQEAYKNLYNTAVRSFPELKNPRSVNEQAEASDKGFEQAVTEEASNV